MDPVARQGRGPGPFHPGERVGDRQPEVAGLLKDHVVQAEVGARVSTTDSVVRAESDLGVGGLPGSTQARVEVAEDREELLAWVGVESRGQLAEDEVKVLPKRAAVPPPDRKSVV